MSADNSPNQPAPPNNAPGITDWQQVLQSEAEAPAGVSTAPVSESEPEDELACGLCYRPFLAEDLTVASKERFNWESSVVVCPECLTELKLELRSRSKAP